MKPLIPATGIFFALFLTETSFADDARPLIRTSLAKHERIWTGQQVTLVIELLAPGYFSGTPFYDLPKIPRTLILPPARPPIVSSEQIGQTSYNVQRYEFTLLSQRSGRIEIPPFDIRFDYKRNPLDHDSISQTGKTTAITFTVTSPPGRNPDDNLITSTDLTVTETWNPVPGPEAKAGDAFVRTITWSASDVPAMAFPPFDPPPVEGLGIYPATPEITEQNDRSGNSRQRVDRITYLCKTGGHKIIPAVEMRWWNPASQEMQHAVFPSRAFDIAAAPAPPVTSTERFGIWIRGHAWTAAALATAAIILRLTRRRWHQLFQRLSPRYLAPLNPS